MTTLWGSSKSTFRGPLPDPGRAGSYCAALSKARRGLTVLRCRRPGGVLLCCAVELFLPLGMLAAGVQPAAGSPPGKVVGRGQLANGPGPPGPGHRPGLDRPSGVARPRYSEGRDPPPDAGHKRPKDEPGQDDVPKSDHYPNDEQHDDPHGDNIAYSTRPEIGSISPTARPQDPGQHYDAARSTFRYPRGRSLVLAGPTAPLLLALASAFIAACVWLAFDPAALREFISENGPGSPSASWNCRSRPPCSA